VGDAVRDSHHQVILNHEQLQMLGSLEHSEHLIENANLAFTASDRPPNHWQLVADGSTEAGSQHVHPARHHRHRSRDVTSEKVPLHPGELAHTAVMAALRADTAIIAAAVPSLRHLIIGSAECRGAPTARRGCG
jgi:hypothetical protein